MNIINANENNAIPIIPKSLYLYFNKFEEYSDEFQTIHNESIIRKTLYAIQADITFTEVFVWF